MSPIKRVSIVFSAVLMFPALLPLRTAFAEGKDWILPEERGQSHQFNVGQGQKDFHYIRCLVGGTLWINVWNDGGDWDAPNVIALRVNYGQRHEVPVGPKQKGTIELVIRQRDVISLEVDNARNLTGTNYHIILGYAPLR